jgi:hypothetical protein
MWEARLFVSFFPSCCREMFRKLRGFISVV